MFISVLSRKEFTLIFMMTRTFDLNYVDIVGIRMEAFVLK